MSRKSVLISGASRGIGAAMVERFKRDGWFTIGLSRSAASGADLPIVCDVSDVQSVKAALAKISAPIQALVCNAGLAGSNPMEPGTSDELWHQIIDVNLNGTYYLCKYALPMMPDGAGRIVNIASVLALKGVPDQTAYCAAKHAVLGFTRALSHWTASRKITVNVICPGWTRTEMALGRMSELAMSEPDIEASVPLGRFVEPAEVADLAFYLAASPAASAITGQSFTIDGGVLA